MLQLVKHYVTLSQLGEWQATCQLVVLLQMVLIVEVQLIAMVLHLKLVVQNALFILLLLLLPLQEVPKQKRHAI